MSISSFNQLLQRKGHDVTIVRDNSSLPCPCLTPQGYRNPEWHIENSNFPVCNKAGFLPANNEEIVVVTVKAFIQPILASRSSRMALAMNSGMVEKDFGNVLADTQLGIFPVRWNGNFIDFRDWSRAGTDYITIASDAFDRKFTVVGVVLIPDPITGNAEHHYETNLRVQQ